MTANIQLRYAETDGIKTLQYRVGWNVLSMDNKKTIRWDDWREVPTVVIDRLLTDKVQP